LLVVVAVLVVGVRMVAAPASPFPDCPFQPKIQIGRFKTFEAEQSKRCMALCNTTSCVGSPRLLGPLVRCLNITASTTLDFSDLKKQKDGVCVFVSADVILKNPLRLGDGDDCVHVSMGAIVGDIFTGKGDDFVYLNTTASARNIDLGPGEDVLELSSGNVVTRVNGGPGKDFIYGLGTTALPDIIGEIQLGDGGDYLNITNARINNIDGSGGSDIVYLNNTLVARKLDVGGASDFVALANSNVTKLEGGKGENIFYVQGTNNTIVTGDLYDDDDDSSIVCGGPAP